METIKNCPMNKKAYKTAQRIQGAGDIKPLELPLHRLKIARKLIAFKLKIMQRLMRKKQHTANIKGQCEKYPNPP